VDGMVVLLVVDDDRLASTSINTDTTLESSASLPIATIGGHRGCSAPCMEVDARVVQLNLLNALVSIWALAVMTLRYKSTMFVIFFIVTCYNTLSDLSNCREIKISQVPFNLLGFASAQGFG